VPGTIGSIPAWLLGYFLLRENLGNWAMVIAAAATTILSVWLAGEAEKMFGRDARKIVIDEWAGMFITFILVPFSLVNYVIAFVAFRGFDVVKIFPARQSESLPGGWGVTADDVIAGIQACLFTHLVVYLINNYI
jgi:phosphatidylglycerophosphatase A